MRHRVGGIVVPAVIFIMLAGASPTRADSGFAVRTVGDLAGVCSGGPERAAAENFCDGYAQGILSLMREHEAKSVCLPDHPPTRRQTMAEFVSWSKAKEERASLPASRGLETFFKDRFACK